MKEIAYESVLNLVIAMILVRFFLVIAIAIILVTVVFCMLVGHGDFSLTVFGISAS